MSTRGTRGPLGVALAALVLLLAGCGGEDGDAAPAPTSTSSSPSTTTTSTTPTTLPEGSVKVPIAEDLVEALPRLLEVDGIVSEDPVFDERLCDGRKAPTVPEAQARATYVVSPTETITIAAYRFPSGVGPYYMSLYTESVRSCAIDAGDSADLGLEDGVGFAYELETTRGKAFIAIALRDDVLWVLLQEDTDGPPSVDPSTLDRFLEAVEA